MNRTIKNAPLFKGPSLLTQTRVSAVPRAFIKILLYLCNIRIPYVKDETRLKDLFAVCMGCEDMVVFIHFHSHLRPVQQFDVRGEQAILLPKQSLVLREREQEDLAFAAAQYIRSALSLFLHDALIAEFLFYKLLELYLVDFE